MQMKLLSPATVPAALLAAALGLAACGGDEGAEPRAASGDRVNVKTFMFDPDPITVERGATVTWTNADQTVHTVTSGERGDPDGRFDADLDESGGEFSRTFDRAGTYRYFCSRHSGPGMEGEVVVE